MTDDKKKEGTIELAIGADGAKARVDRRLLEFVFPGRVQLLNRIEQARQFESATMDRIIRKVNNEEPLTPDERLVLCLTYGHEADKVENFARVLERASAIRNALPPKVESSQEPEPVDADWLLRFREGAQSFSDPVMQEVMARILNGEYEKPGSFSMRTLAVVRDLDRETAEIFAALCRCVWGQGSLPYFDWEGYKQRGISYADMLRADDAGLIDIRSSTVLNPDPDGKFHIPVANWIARAQNSPAFQIHPLTTAGEELFSISDVKPGKEDAADIFARLGRHFMVMEIAPCGGGEKFEDLAWQSWKAGDPLP